MIFKCYIIVTFYIVDMKSDRFNQKHLEGDKGKLMLEITKTFKGDSRFKLDDKFEKDVDIE